MKNLKLALLGNPVKHSLTPLIIKDLGEYFNIEVEYDLISMDGHTPIEEISKTILDYDAVNVTYPLKRVVADIISTDLIDVNMAIKIPLDSEYGFNHDGLAFWDSIRHREFGSILLIGSGITAQRIIDEANLSEIKVGVLARHPKELEEYCDISLYRSPEEVDFSYDIVVNCTPVTDELPFGEDLLQIMNGLEMCIDLNYSKETQFLKAYKQQYQKIHGPKKEANIMNGLPMLIENALRTFRILTHNKYSMCTMRSAYNDLNLQRYAE